MFFIGKYAELVFFESKRICCIIHLEMKRKYVNVDLNRKMSSSQTRLNISEKSTQNKLIQFLNSSENPSTTYTPCRCYLVHLCEFNFVLREIEVATTVVDAGSIKEQKNCATDKEARKPTEGFRRECSVRALSMARGRPLYVPFPGTQSFSS